MQIKQETLSSVMDGATGSVDGATLGAIAADAEARATWARYHLIGDVMRDGLIEVAPPEFSDRLRLGIADEPTVLAPQTPARPLLRPVAGFAIAASVAALAVVGIKQLTPEQETTPAIVASAPAMPGDARRAAAEAQTVVDPRADSLHSQRRLNSYLVKFNEQRSSLGVPGVKPYVRIVGFEAD
jgi:sigma-E factor negative regulatory protein RseA